MKSVMVSIPERGKVVSCNSYNGDPCVAPSILLPTNLCNLLSHKGAALRPLATNAKKAFFT